MSKFFYHLSNSYPWGSNENSLWNLEVTCLRVIYSNTGEILQFSMHTDSLNDIIIDGWECNFINRNNTTAGTGKTNINKSVLNRQWKYGTGHNYLIIKKDSSKSCVTYTVINLETKELSEVTEDILYNLLKISYVLNATINNKDKVSIIGSVYEVKKFRISSLLMTSSKSYIQNRNGVLISYLLHRSYNTYDMLEVFIDSTGNIKYIKPVKSDISYIHSDLDSNRKYFNFCKKGQYNSFNNTSYYFMPKVFDFYMHPDMDNYLLLQILYASEDKYTRFTVYNISTQEIKDITINDLYKAVNNGYNFLNVEMDYKTIPQKLKIVGSIVVTKA